jgi:hypothetical protein
MRRSVTTVLCDSSWDSPESKPICVEWGGVDIGRNPILIMLNHPFEPLPCREAQILLGPAAFLFRRPLRRLLDIILHSNISRLV